jgi:hypothetical protein
MIQTLAAHLSGLDEDLEVRGHFALSGKIGKTQRSERIVLLLFGHLLSDIEFHEGLWVMGYGLRVF